MSAGDVPEPLGTTAAAPLTGMRVVELADDWGAQCGRILADLGADVIKVEPPDGDGARRRPPFVGDHAGADRGLWWIALNLNKRGVTLDLAQPGGIDVLRRLVAGGDVFVEALGPRELARLGIGAGDLSSWNERLIHTTVTPYGSEGPLASAPASDLEVTAASGALWLAGEPGRPPVRTTLPQSPFWAGMYAAMGTLFAYLARGTTGRGQRVDTSAQASMVTVHPPAPVFWSVLGEEHRRLGPFLLGRSIVGARFRNIWRCKDGYVAFAIQGGAIGRHTGKMLVEWMASRGEVPEALRAIDWERFDNTTLRQEDVERLEVAIAPFFEGVTKREFFEGVVARNMLGYPVSTVAEVYDDPQLRARGFWQELEVPEAGRTVPIPGGFALFDGERPRVRRPAPRLGEHNAEVFHRELGLGQGELAATRAAVTA
ncbi:MAG: CaiB/BaiF CoA transferase family protein [Candidatus Limnocylindria bacterium]